MIGVVEEPKEDAAPADRAAAKAQRVEQKAAVRQQRLDERFQDILACEAFYLEHHLLCHSLGPICQQKICGRAKHPLRIALPCSTIKQKQ